METGEVRGYTDFGTDRIVRRVRAKCDTWAREEIQANARRVLELYGWRISDAISVDIPREEAAKVLITVEWNYHGGSGWSYGQDEAGRNYELSPDGKVKRIYSLHERDEVTTYARRYGAAEVGREFNIPVNTIRSWVGRKRAETRKPRNRRS